MKTLKIRNFQSHADTALVFEPGVNVIVGSSDSGKSAILRSIYWLLTNRPSGDAFRSSWGGDSFVEVDGVTRRRTDKENAYVLDGEVLKALGQDVPEEVRTRFNFADVNLQRQLDAPFLLADTPGQVAQYLNGIVGLDVIDRTISAVEGKKREVRKNISVWTTEKEANDKALEKFEGLDQIEKHLEGIEAKAAELLQVTADQARVRSQMEALRDAFHRVQALPRVGTVQAFEEVASKADRLPGLETEAQRIRTRLVEISGILSEIKTKTVLLEELEEELAESMPDVCPVCGSVVAKEVPT